MNMKVNARELVAAGLLGVLLAGGAGCAVKMLADAGDLKEFPLPASIAGDPPGSGPRYWAKSFERPPYTVPHDGNLYMTVTQPPGGGLEYWANAWGEGDTSERTVFVRRGPALDKLGERVAARRAELAALADGHVSAEGNLALPVEGRAGLDAVRATAGDHAGRGGPAADQMPADIL
jgi:hypothetical protein